MQYIILDYIELYFIKFTCWLFLFFICSCCCCFYCSYYSFIPPSPPTPLFILELGYNPFKTHMNNNSSQVRAQIINTNMGKIIIHNNDHNSVDVVTSILHIYFFIHIYLHMFSCICFFFFKIYFMILYFFFFVYIN